MSARAGHGDISPSWARRICPSWTRRYIPKLGTAISVQAGHGDICPSWALRYLPKLGTAISPQAGHGNISPSWAQQYLPKLGTAISPQAGHGDICPSWARRYLPKLGTAISAQAGHGDICPSWGTAISAVKEYVSDTLFKRHTSNFRVLYPNKIPGIAQRHSELPIKYAREVAAPRARGSNLVDRCRPPTS
jgi:hypothetical protein